LSSFLLLPPSSFYRPPSSSLLPPPSLFPDINQALDKTLRASVSVNLSVNYQTAAPQGSEMR
jgi:hypothetical protein